MNEKKQSCAPATKFMKAEDFEKQDGTTIHWLGNAGVMINSWGTCVMIDPLLEGFDMPLLIDMPILPKEVPHLDAVLITHCDNDHFSRVTCKNLAPVCKAYHSTQYVSQLMREEELLGIGHDIGESFVVGDIKATLTPADHAWQNEHKKYNRVFQFEGYCGFWIETPDGTIWAPGDSRLLEEHLQMPQPDVIIFDFSDDGWHIGLEGAIKLANTYPDARLILSHWGSVDAPNMKAFNANPQSLYGRVENLSRVKILAPGELFKLERSK